MPRHGVMGRACAWFCSDLYVVDVATRATKATRQKAADKIDLNLTKNPPLLLACTISGVKDRAIDYLVYVT
jgi:hypothetical protein